MTKMRPLKATTDGSHGGPTGVPDKEMSGQRFKISHRPIFSSNIWQNTIFINIKSENWARTMDHGRKHRGSNCKTDGWNGQNTIEMNWALAAQRGRVHRLHYPCKMEILKMPRNNEKTIERKLLRGMGGLGRSKKVDTKRKNARKKRDFCLLVTRKPSTLK